MMVIFVTLLIALMLLCAVLAAQAARKWSGGASLPGGRVLYSDTGSERRPAKTLVSRKYRLKGRPDYLIETSEGLIPVELKSTRAPARGRPYDSHLMQLACYCLLCEEAMQAHVPYGLIRYREVEIRVDYTPQLRAQLVALLSEMQSARRSPIVHRSHQQPARCLGCGFRDQCDEALA